MMFLSFGVLLFIAASWCSSYGAETGKALGPTENATLAKCGQSNLAVSNEKVTGVAVSIGNFPWQATFFKKDSYSDKWQLSCVGTLVSTRAVLTVAHCVKNVLPQDLRVALGKTNGDWYNSEPTEIKRAVKEIRVHNLYDPTKSAVSINDIAVLVLDSDVEVSSSTMPACLDDLQAGLQHTRLHDGFVTSWGNPDNCTGDCDLHKRSLTYNQATIQDYNTCLHNGNRLVASFLTPDKFCSDEVVYPRDSGAGLTFVFDGSHFLHGIASGKFKGGDGQQTLVLYTNITSHRDWIKSNLT